MNTRGIHEYKRYSYIQDTCIHGQRRYPCIHRVSMCIGGIPVYKNEPTKDINV